MNKSESKYFNTARKMDGALIMLLEKKAEISPVHTYIPGNLIKSNLLRKMTINIILETFYLILHVRHVIGLDFTKRNHV